MAVSYTPLIDHRKLTRKLTAVLDKRGVDPRVYELLCI